MFSASAELYDQIYATIKDYPAETARIAALLRERHPACRTALDVACGTGTHAQLLARDHGFEADGLDLDPRLLAIARAKHPAGRFVEADMTDFHLGRRYDAVLCLFSSIGYARTLRDVGRALSCFRAHVHDDGVVLVEPWFPPGVLEDGRRDARTVEAGPLRITRQSRTELLGGISRIHFDYTIEGPEGTRHASEVHDLGLFTVDEQLAAFRAARFDVEHDPEGPMGRGLFIARPR